MAAQGRKLDRVLAVYQIEYQTLQGLRFERINKAICRASNLISCQGQRETAEISK
jgi:hypothetical protein